MKEKHPAKEQKKKEKKKDRSSNKKMQLKVQNVQWGTLKRKNMKPIRT